MVFLIIDAKNDRKKYVDSIIAVVQDNDIETYIEHMKKTINDTLLHNSPAVFIDAEIIKVTGIEYNLVRAVIMRSIHELGEPCSVIADLCYRWYPIWIPE